MDKKEKPAYTRKINPKLGLLGILGLLGFMGLIPEIYNLRHALPVPTFYLFFGFFGFFGFYYEGKMSNTFMDERYAANAFRASAAANKTALLIIIGVALLSMCVFKISDAYIMLSVLIAAIGLAFGISIFLQEYLLYRYENEE